MSAMCLEEDPIMNAAHGFRTHVCDIRVLYFFFFKFRMGSSMCMSLSSLWFDYRETYRTTASLFQANSSPASGDFAVAGTSKWISPTSPQAINGLFFFSLPFLSCLLDLYSLQACPASWVHS